jgi:uncharacterized membrane protein
LNGGTCVDGINSYTCSCTGGYYGTLCDTAHFEWLGGTYSSVRGISADGLVVVGSNQGASSVDLPARWTKADGWQMLVSNLYTIDQGTAWAANTDGSVIVGQANITAGGGAFRWTAAGGVVSLGYDAGSLARGVSANGNTVVGRRQGTESSPLQHIFRWQSGTTSDLGAITTCGDVYGCSSDGTVVVGGYCPTSAGGNMVPFRWTQNTGVGALTNDTGGYATGISLDGSTIIGNVTSAFRWVNNVGYSYMSLGSLTSPNAYAVNGDGTVVVGMSVQGGWIWSTTDGVRMLNAVMTAYGVDMSIWSTVVPQAVSSDGKVVAGYGYRNNTYTSWIARL